MASLDPWLSVRIRAEFLNLVVNEKAFHASAVRRTAILAWLDENGWIEETGLRLRDPIVEIPWTKGVIHGSWLHWHWTAQHAMYPPSLSEAINLMRKGDRSGVEPCLVFLEADPWCDKSGYVKQDIVKHIRKVDLLYRQIQRLLDALLIPVFVGPRIEFREYCRTARAFASPEFRQLLRALAGNPKQRWPMTGVEQRALWMLEAIDRPYQS